MFLVDIKKLLTHSLTHSKSYYHSCWLNFSLRFLCSQNGECCPVLPCHAPSVPCVRWNDVIRGVYSIEAWTQPASLKKTRGNENHAYFRENWGEEKLTGEERLNYLSTYLHCLLIFSKIFLLALLARLHFIFIPNQGTRNIVLYGRDGKVHLAFKSGTKRRRFSVPLLMTWCYQIDHTQSKLNIELYTFSCTGRQSCREQDN